VPVLPLYHRSPLVRRRSLPSGSIKLRLQAGTRHLDLGVQHGVLCPEVVSSPAFLISTSFRRFGTFS
jgi:hypothetical protein